MTTRNSSALGAALALALAGTASAAPADSLRVPVGDVSTPAGAHALEARIDAAAARLCEPSYALIDLGGWSYCLSSVRESAMRQLTPAQRQDYAAATRSPPVALASR